METETKRLWHWTDVDDQDIAALRRVEQRLFPGQEVESE